MGKKILVVSMVMVLGAVLLGASMLVAHDLTGRDVVETGEVTTLEGTLRLESSEWYLDTDDGSYLLHFGNRAYLEKTGVDLEEGDRITVDGFSAGSDVAVVSVKNDGETFIFRNTDGTPRWAGRGERYARCDGKRSDERRRALDGDGNPQFGRMGCGRKDGVMQGRGGEGRNGLKPNGNK